MYLSRRLRGHANRVRQGTQSKLAREHMSLQATLTREYISTQSLLTREARKHSRQVGT